MTSLDSSGHFMQFLAQNVFSKLTLPPPTLEEEVGEHVFCAQICILYYFVN